MKTKFILLVFLFISIFTVENYAQLVVTIPSFPAEDDLVEVTFNATLGNGGLAGYTGDVYAHTGVITNLSTGPSDWKYVKTGWGVNTSATRLTRIGTDLYKLTITPDIRQYYGVPANEQILKMAFVFRSSAQVGGSYLEGKTATGGDIFVDVYEAGLYARINLPSQYGLLVSPGQQITFQASSNSADSMFMYINDNLYKSVAGNSINDILTAGTSGKFRVKVKAKNSTEIALDSMYYYIQLPATTASLPQGLTDGITYNNNQSVTLCLYAPNKESVFVLGDFNNWEYDDAGYLYRTPDGKRYWREITNLEAGKEYIFQYLVDGSIRIGDPYADKVSDPWNDKYISESTYPGILSYPEGKAQGVATVFQTAQVPYTWEVQNFVAPEKTDLVIYELLIRDFVAKHDYLTLIDTLQYLKKLGVNAIELMPVSEFEGNLSWGYNPNYYFAPDKYYGPKNDLKKFIDECHKNGIAVIMDMVLNHSFGTSPMVMLYWDEANDRPAANNPWFNPIAKHDFNVGFDFNHESPETKALVNRVVSYWLTEYKVDGYRFDLSKGFTQTNTLGNTGAWGQYDASRIAIWKNIANYIWSVNPDTYIILEHFADNSEEKELANYGMMLWASGTHDNYKEGAMGWNSNSNFSSASYKSRGWDSPHLVAYMESHDEERMVFKNITYGNSGNPYYNIKDTSVSLLRAGLAATFFYTIPGPKMIWQFGELGYDYSIDFNGRVGEKPIRWDYLNDYRRYALNKITSSLIKLKKENDVFRTTDFTLDLSSAFKKIILRHSSMSAVVLGNFDINTGNIVPDFSQTGKWYEYFSGDSIIVTSTSAPIALQAGEFRIYTTKKLNNPEIGLWIPSIQTGDNQILGYPYPNPSNNLFTIPLYIASSTEIELSVFDLSGRKLDNIYNGKLFPGLHEFTWQPKNDQNLTSSGVYILRMVSENNTETIRLIYQ
jgi:1,4-alpha-glucan branching enzyme